MSGDVYKIVVCGPTYSGKSALVKRAKEGEFSSQHTETIGAMRHVLSSNGTRHNGNSDTDQLEVWELGGAERYRNIGGLYYPGAKAIILVTDLKDWEDYALAPNRVVNVRSVKANKQAWVASFIDDLKIYFPASLPPLYIVGTNQDIAVSEGFEQTAVGNLNAFAKDKGIRKEHVFITTSKYGEGTSREAQFKSPSNIFKAVYDELKEIKTKQHDTHGKSGAGNPGTDSSVARGEPIISRNNLKTRASWGSRIVALVIGAIEGAVMGLVIHNPVTCFLAAWRTTDWAEWSIPNIFRVFIFAPFINPLVAVGYGAVSGGAVGLKQGVSKKLLDIPRNMSEPFKLRTIITGSALSILIGAAVVVAAIHLIPVALPIILGVAGAGALVASIGYEGVDSVLTDSEAQEALKNRSASRPLISVEEYEPSSEPQARSRLSSRTVSSRTHQSSVMLVNAYENADNAGSWRSWFQVPPATPAVSIDIPHASSNPQVQALSRSFDIFKR
jgi:hypothetical protein